jgi:ssDNA-binding Zn-finger/Zn-ribbon topoisomerase 1
MSDITNAKCNNCGKETPNRMEENGWIAIKPSYPCERYSIEASFGKRGGASTRRTFDAFDFCQQACLIEWVDKLANNKAWGVGINHD